VWLVPSIYVDAYPKSVYVQTRKFIQDAIENMELYRVQATIKEHDQTSIRWIEKLGFVREGLMMKFGPNQENQFMYARVK
jgi:RimJ/RimL family protein N-acetyltransferase